MEIFVTSGGPRGYEAIMREVPPLPLRSRRPGARDMYMEERRALPHTMLRAPKADVVNAIQILNATMPLQINVPM